MHTWFIDVAFKRAFLESHIIAIAFNGMMWHDMELLNKGYSFYKAAEVVTSDRRGLSHYFNILFKLLYTNNKTECFSYKGRCGVHGHMCIKAFKRRAGLGYR